MAAHISLDSAVLFINFVRACMAGAIMAATSLSPVRYLKLYLGLLLLYREQFSGCAKKWSPRERNNFASRKNYMDTDRSACCTSKTCFNEYSRLTCQSSLFKI